MIDLKEIKGNIGIIDNDMLNRKNPNFPNLALMKISSYYKSMGNNVEICGWNDVNSLFKKDWYFVSKVFSDTPTPEIIQQDNIIYGGSGFFYDKAEFLPDYIEHIKPDYDLYKLALNKYIAPNRNHYYQNHSIGFMTRGCIRQCEFCINKHFKKVSKHSELEEFYEPSKPYITLLDDNITAYKDFENVIETLKSTGKNFVFKQGMDFRLLTEKKMRILQTIKRYGITGNNTVCTFYFAFDNYSDREIMGKKLKLWNEIFKKTTFKTFYVLTGFNRTDNNDFYDQDYYELIERIKILFENKAKAFIMLYNNCEGHKYLKQIKILKLFCNYVVKLGSMSLVKYCEHQNIDTSIFKNGELELEYKY